MSSVGSEGSESSNSSRAGEIVKTGYLKKLKTMKKKFFVLRADSSSTQACLEYYDTGKKWKNNHPPKRSIILRNCFNINRRTDTKHKYVIALFTGNDCFGIVLDCEDDMLDWLKLLLMYQQGEDMVDCGSLKPYYEQVWKVTIQKKELACKHNLSGVYLLCLTECTLSLVKHATEEEQDMKHYEFSLQSIRRCGNLDAFFYMELGQASCLGSGNLWMQAEDSNTAHHMHSVIMNACTNCPKKELAPKSRSRSSSANEASKPISFGRKWPSSGDDSLSVISHAKSQCHQEHTTPVGHSVSSVGEGNHHHHHNLASVPYSPYPPIRRASTGTRPVTAGPALLSSARTNSSHTGRERCDSLPTRPRMTLDSLSHARSGNTVSHLTPVSGRPHSMYTRGIFSPSGCSHPTSPMSATYSTDSAGSSLSVDGDSENCSEMESFRKIILEENAEDYVQWGGNQNKNFLAENIPHMNNTCRNIKTICHHSSSNSQSSCSPCSSSPMDAAGYMPMSPESIAENRNRQQLNRSYDSVNHSRESSIHEDVGEGYVPMAPLSVDTGYMSMDQSSRKPGDLSPGLSSCSITSGTPSTDARYLLDKVSSYLTPSDDDIIFNVRQTRAYSTGSKPDGSHNKFVRCDSADGLRVRAFSVGSRCGTHMPPTPRRTPASTSTSSIEPCDDLMEIDFSANKLRHRHIRTRMKHQNSPSTCGGVVHTSNEKLTVPHSTASLMFNDGYMDMSPKSSPKLESFCDSRSYSLDSSANVSPPRLSKHLMGRSAPISVGYGTKQAYAKGSPSTSGCLEKVVEAESQGSNSSSKLRLSDEESSYMDMKPGVYDVPDGVPKVTAVIATASDLHVRKENFTVLDPSGSRTSNTCATLPHIKQPLIDTEGKHFKNMSADKSNGIGTPDGYVDMTFKGRRVENQTAKLVARIPEKTPEGYVDMSFKGSRKNLVDSNSVAKVADKTPTCCAGKENQLLDPRQSSKPIAIQQSKCKRSVGSGFFRRKQSDEQATSKPNFLPLGLSISNSFASLGRKNKKTCQKKDKAAESPATSNSGTIFPLSPDRTPSLDYDPKSKCAISATGESIRLTCDYEAQSLERVDEMVNWSRRCSEDDQLGEYTVMTPGVAPLQRKKSEPACLSYSLNRVNLKSDQARGKILHRSTSVPSAMSAMKNRCPSFSEFGRTECCQEVEDRSENKTTRGSNRMDVDVAETPREATLNLVDVPNAFAGENANVIRLREKVMYATLELPPASEQDENSVKDESESSSNAKIPDQSNLTYAQIDFEKASSSSSN